MNEELLKSFERVENQVKDLEDLVLRLFKEKGSKHNNLKISDSIKRKVCDYYDKSKQHTYQTTALKFNIGTTTVYRILAENRAKKNMCQRTVLPLKKEPALPVKARGIDDLITWVNGPALPWSNWCKDSIYKIASLGRRKFLPHENGPAIVYAQIYSKIEKQKGIRLSDVVKKLPLYKNKPASKAKAVAHLGLCDLMTTLIKQRAIDEHVPLCRLEQEESKIA